MVNWDITHAYECLIGKCYTSLKINTFDKCYIDQTNDHQNEILVRDFSGIIPFPFTTKNQKVIARIV